jgi:hypothetical protein
VRLPGRGKGPGARSTRIASKGHRGEQELTGPVLRPFCRDHRGTRKAQNVMDPFRIIGDVTGASFSVHLSIVHRLNRQRVQSRRTRYTGRGEHGTRSLYGRYWWYDRGACGAFIAQSGTIRLMATILGAHDARVLTRTVAPVCGASITSPVPMTMPTWPGRPLGPGSLPMVKIKSPGAS